MNGLGEDYHSHKERLIFIKNPAGFISITVGSGGKLRGIGSDPKPFTPAPDNCKYPDLVAAFYHNWAFLTLKIDGKKLRGTVISTESHEIVDVFQVFK